MKIPYLLLLIFFIIIYSCCYGEDNSESELFTPPIVNEGCPEGAFCTKKYGTLSISLLKIFQKKQSENKTLIALKKFQKKNGTPIGVWPLIGPEENLAIIAWNSFCQHHQKADKDTFIGKIFLKNLSEIDRKKFKTDTAYLLKNNKITTYSIPAKEIPIKLTKEGLVFIEELNGEGEYYNIVISNKGITKIIKTVKPSFFPQTIKCPELLIKHLNKHPFDSSLFSGFYCKKIENFNSKVELIVMLPQSC